MPAPKNPFAVDIEYFQSLPLAESVLATGAMANFLRTVLAHKEHFYDAKSESTSIYLFIIYYFL